MEASLYPSGSVADQFALQQQDRIEQLTTELSEANQKHDALESRVAMIEKQATSLSALTPATAVRDLLLAAFDAEATGTAFTGDLIYEPSSEGVSEQAVLAEVLIM